MRKFKYDDGTDGIEYESLDELLTLDIVYMAEYNGCYYIKPRLEGPYDNSLYKVDKKTGKVSFMYFTDFFEFVDEATPIDPKTLKRDS